MKLNNFSKICELHTKIREDFDEHEKNDEQQRSGKINIIVECLITYSIQLFVCLNVYKYFMRFQHKTDGCFSALHMRHQCSDTEQHVHSSKNSTFYL